LSYAFGVDHRVQADSSLGETGNREIVRATAECQDQQVVWQRAGAGKQAAAVEVQTGHFGKNGADAGLDEVSQRKAHISRRSRAASDTWQFGQDLVVVVLVDEFNGGGVVFVEVRR